MPNKTHTVIVRWSEDRIEQQIWTKEDYFCPCCGKKSVWANHDGGDYYHGETYLCVACDNEWNWPNTPSVEKNYLPNIAAKAQLKVWYGQ